LISTYGIKIYFTPFLQPTHKFKCVFVLDLKTYRILLLTLQLFLFLLRLLTPLPVVHFKWDSLQLFLQSAQLDNFHFVSASFISVKSVFLVIFALHVFGVFLLEEMLLE